MGVLDEFEHRRKKRRLIGGVPLHQHNETIQTAERILAEDHIVKLRYSYKLVRHFDRRKHWKQYIG